MTLTPPAFDSRSSLSDGPVALPLAPFLESLRTDGIRTTLHDYERLHLALRCQDAWTTARLRSVLSSLLVHDPEQQAVFERRFDQFFGLGDEEQAEYSAVDLARALADLRSLGQETLIRPERPRRMFARRERRGRVVKSTRKKGFAIWALVAVLVSIAVWFAVRLIPEKPPPEHVPPPPPSREVPPPPRDVDEIVLTGTKTYLVPIVTGMREELDAYKWSTLLSTAFLLALLGHIGWLRMRRPPTEDAPPVDPDGPRLFRAGSIGGEPASRLDAETLDLLADALGYFRSEETGSRLDVERSVAAAGRHGGIPHLVFERRKRVRGVVVLEDALAEPGAWNPIARELARGLERRGVPVLFGRFHGVPERFYTGTGSTLELEDLEDDRHGYLVLVFSDGKGLREARDRFALEALSRWPWVAWMELRERRAWDESTAWPARFGLPLYPASREGLLKALGRFATEQSPQADESQGWESWRGGPTGSASQLAEHDLERLLGDALPWAQSCSMMVPPLGLGLADVVRRKFHPELPPERIDRLLTLPGASRSGAGLRFSRRLLALLRRGFLARNSAERQREVLELFITEIRRVEPSTTESLEHHAWEWRLERLRLEIEPDRALKRLTELSNSPLRSAIEGEIGQLGDRDEAVPLRARPKTQRGRKRLQALANREGAKTGEVLGGWHRLVTFVLGLGCLGSAVWASMLALNGPDTVSLQWGSLADVLEGSLTLETSRDGGWESVETADLAAPKRLILERGREYRVRLAGKEGEPALVDLGVVRRDLVLGIGAERRAPEERKAAMRFRYLPPDTFLMGSPEDEQGRDDDEKRHQVKLTRGFWIGETEVTQEQWSVVMGNNPSHFRNCGGDCPIERVSWFDAVSFANRLSDQQGLSKCYVMAGCSGAQGTGCPGDELYCASDYTCDKVELQGLNCTGYRLPTEAEWEYAARAGTDTAVYTGELRIRGDNDSPELDDIAWYRGNSGGRTHPVGTRKENEWGVYDMLGNVWEWTWDQYAEYGGDPEIDPLGAEGGAFRVDRGGGWSGVARFCRAASRDRFDPRYRFVHLGFRLVRTSE